MAFEPIVGDEATAGAGRSESSPSALNMKDVARVVKCAATATGPERRCSGPVRSGVAVEAVRGELSEVQRWPFGCQNQKVNTFLIERIGQGYITDANFIDDAIGANGAKARTLI